MVYEVVGCVRGGNSGRDVGGVENRVGLWGMGYGVWGMVRGGLG